MVMPPLYKYLDVRGAKLTLGNRTFKHAKPSDFNDTEDLTIQSIFSEDIDAALKRIEHGLTDVILQHLDDPPTCDSPLREKVALIQRVYRENPEAADMVRAELAGGVSEPIFDNDHMRAMVEEFVAEINEFMQDYRVLCVSSHIVSEIMWARYAENHKGIALRIKPSIEKDSKFQLFRPVIYREKRPSLYDDTLEFMAGSLFGNQQAHRMAMLEKIVYAKTLDWECEGEYRLAVPVAQDKQPWDILPYHPEELTELYLGLAMEKASVHEIIEKARAVNPDIGVFQIRRRNLGNLEIKRL